MVTVAIERIKAPSAELFTRGYEDKRKPVIIEGMLTKWPAITQWNTNYFREQIGNVIVPLRVKPQSAPPGYFAGKPDEKLPLKQMQLAKYLDLIETGRSTDVYLSGVSIPDFFPSLENDIPNLPYINTTGKIKKQLWLGIKGTVAPLHCDIWDNFLCQVSGTKRLVLFDSRDTSCLYPYSSFSKAPHISKMNIDSVDTNEFPRFKEVVGYEGIIEPGDVLFMPAGWWHQVWTLDESISVNFWWFRRRTVFAPWFFRFYPFMALHYRRHQKVQGRSQLAAVRESKHA